MNLFVDSAFKKIGKRTISKDDLEKKLTNIMIKYKYSKDDTSYTAHEDLQDLVPYNFDNSISRKARQYYALNIYFSSIPNSKISNILKIYLNKYFSN